MTDTQWLLDLVEEATNRGHRIRHALARLPSDQGQADALMDLRDLERDYGNVGRLCVEQHEALTSDLALLTRIWAWLSDSPEPNAAILDEIDGRCGSIRVRLARFEELKP